VRERLHDERIGKSGPYLTIISEERHPAVLPMAVLTAMRAARLYRPSERPSVDPELNPNQPNLHSPTNSWVRNASSPGDWRWVSTCTRE
jgi:hypothetical protein